MSERSLSTVFAWDPADFASLMATCLQSPELPFLLKYMPLEGKILEAGCGLGRYVFFLKEKGFDIEGIEINADAVATVQRLRPGARIFVGDVTRLPHADESLAGIISLGVIEHFSEGPESPLREMRRVLRGGQYAIITVPSFNRIRKIKAVCGYQFLKDGLKGNRRLRKWLGKEPQVGNKQIPPLRLYPVHKEKGDFFEYRFSNREFEDLLIRSGFEVAESVPIAHMDGLYHEFGRLFVSFRDWQFHANLCGRWLNRFLSRFPFLHNHMHLCVVRKPIARFADPPLAGSSAAPLPGK